MIGKRFSGFLDRTALLALTAFSRADGVCFYAPGADDTRHANTKRLSIAFSKIERPTTAQTVCDIVWEIGGFAQPQPLSPATARSATGSSARANSDAASTCFKRPFAGEQTGANTNRAGASPARSSAIDTDTGPLCGRFRA